MAQKGESGLAERMISCSTAKQKSEMYGVDIWLIVSSTYLLALLYTPVQGCAL